MRAPAIVLALVATVVTIGVAAAPVDAPAAATREESKPMGPIAIDVHLSAEPMPGVPLAATVTARTDAVAVDRLAIEVRADDSAELAVGAPSGLVERAGSRSWVVTVVPMHASGGNLTVVVFGEIDGVVQAQSVTTKIRSAGAGPTVRALATAPAPAGSENLSLLPVEERF
ncbi:MAG: hypothetical protein ABI640_01970 [Gammaproteobacteria bacterium]